MITGEVLERTTDHSAMGALGPRNLTEARGDMAAQRLQYSSNGARELGNGNRTSMHTGTFTACRFLKYGNMHTM